MTTPNDFMRMGGYADPKFGSMSSLMDYGYGPTNLYSSPLETPANNSMFANGADFSGIATNNAQGYMASNPSAGIGGGTGGWFSNMLPDSMKDWTLTAQKGVNGDVTGGQWGALGQAGLGLFNALQGYNAGKRADEQFQFQKSAYNKNYNAQRQSTNTALEDRQAARVAAGSAESVDSYMNRNRVR